MAAEKRSTFQLLGLPKEFGVVLLTISLILAVSPYLGGADFGIFKVPDFPGLRAVFRLLGPMLLLVVVILFLPVWANSSKQIALLPHSVDGDSKYRLQSIADIVRAEAAAHGVHIDGLQIGDRLHINDLERMCSRVWCPDKSADEIKGILEAARATAFSRKYAEPKEDEKLVDVSNIQIDGLKPWETYFFDFLREIGIDDYNELDILNVGIGNGHAEEPFLSRLHSFKAVDISSDALQYATKKYPQMTPLTCTAESLDGIPNNSVDLYLSLRTYQSTLFDRRTALHEAYRVLRNGGIIVLSIPTMYLQQDGRPLKGLIPPDSTSPHMEYAQHLVGRIEEYLVILNFRDIRTDERSPFEIFLSARR